MAQQGQCLRTRPGPFDQGLQQRDDRLPVIDRQASLDLGQDLCHQRRGRGRAPQASLKLPQGVGRRGGVRAHGPASAQRRAT